MKIQNKLAELLIEIIDEFRPMCGCTFQEDEDDSKCQCIACEDGRRFTTVQMYIRKATV